MRRMNAQTETTPCDAPTEIGLVLVPPKLKAMIATVNDIIDQISSTMGRLRTIA
jgi:hypothetical protein